MESIFKRHGRPDVEQHDLSSTADVRTPYCSRPCVQVHPDERVCNIGNRFYRGEKKVGHVFIVFHPQRSSTMEPESYVLVSLTWLPGTKVAMATLSNTTYIARTQIKWESALEWRRHSLQTTSFEFALFYRSDSQKTAPSSHPCDRIPLHEIMPPRCNCIIRKQNK